MVELKRVRRDAPWSWLKAGWADLVRAPRVALSYGLIFVGAGGLIALALHLANLTAVIPVFLSGFALIGPALATGIYQVSRAIERGEKPRFRVIISRFPSRISQIGFVSILLTLLLMLWVRAAQFLLVAIAPNSPLTPDAFTNFAISDTAGLTLIVIGTIVGGFLAAVAFAMSALSFPMLIDQDVDAVTAMVASFKAVFAQPFVMLTWAWLIAFMVVAGSVVFLVGLAVTFPWIALATWHAYRDFAPTPTPSASAAA
ncbi:DUF2189 domain-containing protein [Maricaulis parjimensis]|uniref:DUF2189 domain-containing protein n=1 Tax=Maricaulis parjimensis TaxID=144023 RepID=UPI001939638D|nr:DUF2189 domain-containing protein [Maricaulis parjimensis]